MDRIAAEREASQPLRSRTGGSTFKNPDGDKAWRLIDEAGCRGLTKGAAQVSEKHCTFLLNLGGASSADIEALGEDVRARVKAKTGIMQIGRASCRERVCPYVLLSAVAVYLTQNTKRNAGQTK